MNAPAIDHELSQQVSNLRDLVTRVSRGVYDDCDAGVILRLKELAGELHDAVNVTIAATIV